MQKLTLTFIYGKDEERKLKYRLTDDIPVGVMMEKLIGFQFVVDSADPTSFEIIHNGTKIEDLTKTFEQHSIADGDEIYLVPTVFDPIPPITYSDLPPKKAKVSDKSESRKPYKNSSFSKELPEGKDNLNTPKRNPAKNPNQRHRRSSDGRSYAGKNRDSQSFAKPYVPENEPQNKNQASTSSAVPFKAKNKNFRRTHKKPSNFQNK